MEQHHVTIDLSIPYPVLGELERAVREALADSKGPWTVIIRPADTPQSTSDWSVVVTRPGHVWLMRAAGAHQHPQQLLGLIRRSVRPEQFSGDGHGLAGDGHGPGGDGHGPGGEGQHPDGGV